MKLIRKAGSTSNILQLFIADSTSTTGAGLTGLLFNSAGLTAYYHKDTDTTATAITLVTMTVGTFTSSGFKEIDATNMPGWYQFCPPDAALSTTGSPKSVAFHLKGATNMAPLPIEVDLDAQVDVTHYNGTAGTFTVAGKPDVTLANGAHGGATATITAERVIVASTTANEPAMKLTGNGSGAGVLSTGGTSGDGIKATGGATTGNGILASAGGGNGDGFRTAGSGSGNGTHFQGGSTGAGIHAVGGATSGHGILAEATLLGDGIRASAFGTSTHGLYLLGGTGGVSDGLKAQAGTGGVPIRGSITGDITGNLSGSVGSVTGSVGSVATGGITAASIADAAIDRATFAADTGLQPVRSGTAQAGSTTSITLDAGASAVNDYYRGMTVYITAGAAAGIYALITSYDGTTKVANWAYTAVVAPDNTSTFAILPEGNANLTLWKYDFVNAVHSGGLVEAYVGQIGTAAISAASFLDGSITSAVLDTTAAAEIATTIWQDLIAGSDFTTVGSIGKLLVTDIDTTISSRGTGTALDAAGVRTAVGLASANLDTQLAAIAGYIDTEVAAIKAKTDNLPASPAATGDIPTVSQIWTTALTEAYRSAGAAGTAAQLLHEILQNLTEFSIVSTTKTVKKFDGSTTAKTYTLDSATAPTSITETT